MARTESDTPVNVICMKWGTAYGAHYVNKLRAMVGRHLSRPFRFICFTDDTSGIGEGVELRPMPEIEVPERYRVSPWRKLAVFTPGLAGLEGKTLFLDLDVVVTGSIDPFFDYSDKLAIIENWTQRGRGIGNSSVFCFEAGRYGHVLERYYAEMDTLFNHHRTDQSFLSETLGREGLAFWPDAWVRSFKVHCLPGGPMNWLRTPHLPEDARIVAFHGHPKPDEAIEGRWPKAKWPGKLYKHVRPTPWVAEHWG